jgi:hypothetical protein
VQAVNDLETLAQTLAAQLGDERNAVPPSAFPRDPETAKHRGMYAWFGDAEATATLSAVLESPLTQPLYSGQAGATSTHAAKQSGATLLSRVRGNHIRGNIYGSTMRCTFAALMLEKLGLERSGRKRLAGDGDSRLSAWIEAHLRVAIVPVDDGVALAHVEPLVLARLDPPLNLMHMPVTPVRRRLKQRRSYLTADGPSK